MVVSPRWRRTAPRVIGVLVGGLRAVYLVGRGVTELWLVDYSNPTSYQNAWGGPSLLGVLAVHSGPGFAVVVAALLWLRRRLRRETADAARRGRTVLPTADRL